MQRAVGLQISNKMAEKVAVVTGSNKGIGFGIVKELLKRGVGTVYLTARDVTRGKEAVENLKKDGYKPEFHQLEVTDKNSVKKFADFLKEKHDGIDILVNNAAVIDKNMLKANYEEAKHVIHTNFNSLLIIQEFIFPTLKENARVVNIASDCGHISNLNNTFWIKRLTRKDIKVKDVTDFVDWFLDALKNGSLSENDFKGTNILSYRVSKIAMCALARVQQNEVKRNISVNSIHPGFVQTDMTSNFGMLTLDQAVEAPVYLALDVDQSVKGQYFWYDKKAKDWANPKEELHVNRQEILDFMKTIDFYPK